MNEGLHILCIILLLLHNVSMVVISKASSQDLRGTMVALQMHVTI